MYSTDIEFVHPVVGSLSLLDDTSQLPRRLESFALETKSPLALLHRVGGYLCACGIPTNEISLEFDFFTRRLETDLERFSVRLEAPGLHHGPSWELNRLRIYWNTTWRSANYKERNEANGYLKLTTCFNVPSLDFQLSQLSQEVRWNIQKPYSKVPLKLFHPLLGLHDELFEYGLQSENTNEDLSHDLAQMAFRLAEENELYSGLEKLRLTNSLPRHGSQKSMHRALSSTFLSKRDWLSMRHRSPTTEPDAGKHSVYIALGGNLGDRLNHLEAACGLMAKGEIKLVRTSGLYETKPMYMEDQGQFLNGVCEVGSSPVSYIS